jgi:hypothetical protein
VRDCWVCVIFFARVVVLYVIGLGFWMSLAPICILYCKQCITMNEYRICWFSRFGFLGEKSYV